jgi:large subunit ribosomal protein L31
MKKNIHPQFCTDTKAICSCWNTFITWSSVKWEIRVETCSKCHPFYTWERKILKTSSVDKFYSRQKKTQWINNSEK